MAEENRIKVMKPTDWVDPRVKGLLEYKGRKDDWIPYDGATGLCHFSDWFPSRRFSSNRPYVGLDLAEDEFVAGREIPTGLDRDSELYFRAFRDLDGYLLSKGAALQDIEEQLARIKSFLPGHKIVSDADKMSFFEFCSPVFAHLINEKGHDPWFLVQ